LAHAWKVVESDLRGVMQVRALDPLDEGKVTARLRYVNVETSYPAIEPDKLRRAA
jgi:hypothetical protein